MSGDGGAVVWITGLPASGKSTLAARLRERLAGLGRAAVVLDGDEVRRALSPAPGYSPEERDAFYLSLARLAAMLARQGFPVLVAATAPERAHRAAARALAPRFVEVFVDVPAEACARRDPKGLWAAARAGQAPTLPGAGAPYQPPEAPEVRARGGEDRAAVEAVLGRLDGRPAARRRSPGGGPARASPAALPASRRRRRSPRSGGRRPPAG